MAIAVSGQAVEVLRYIDRVQRGPGRLPYDRVGAAMFGYLHGVHDASEGTVTLEDATMFVMWLKGSHENWGL